ncbi:MULTISPECIES: branched-chain amino acid ABC transporter permease [Mycobacteriaceae]|uniref:Branched-chain amino acid ABC transporter permease n=1 Tax=Mycolicibacterium parafortuitum TaxID=39692 RepID=A0ACC6MNF1_MYCPF|nr:MULTISPECIES: branched-chain amino acid ABC transporter permease [Mycobacteriaceae]MDZ5088465.1 branched-chain amino acid ABC transporter permease [Mycolicibacterium parafortuitum]GFM19950.1 ABC-type branched-chain amino acid transport system, permease protein I [Mycobacterium sp. PO1]GFM23903.1 ABC-type branched-chain amino acid transport system, permease protein I [Mycobacterium sp. PO2]
MQYVIFGLVTGSILAMATVGFSMVRQTEGFLNIAHGQFLALAAFVGLFASRDLGMPTWFAALFAAATTGVAAVVLSVVVFEPIRQKGVLVQLFSSVGVAYIIYGLLVMIFGANLQHYEVSFGTSYSVAGMQISFGEIAIMATAAVAILALHVFLTKTPAGISVRAVATNPDLARVRGISTRLVSYQVWFIAGFLAGLAGVMIGIIGSVGPELGWQNIILILAAAVLGGLGSTYGVIMASLLLGLAMDLSALLIPTSYRTVVAFAALIIVLLFKPSGLFSVRQRKQAA